MPFNEQLQAGVGVRLGPATPIQDVQGSLAAAFQELNREVEALEATGKGLYERVTPFLEPSPPQATANEKQIAKPSSPLAESVFEYAARVRRARISFAEISDRVSY